MPDSQPFIENRHTGTLAQAIVDTVREPLLVLDKDHALKHAFTDDRIDRQIAVGFAMAGTNWKLSVVDNGIGAPVGVFAHPKSGLGTSIVNALAQQLEARVEVVGGPHGTSVLVTHATFAKKPDEVSQLENPVSSMSVRGHA